jgi:hypothetical protein
MSDPEEARYLARPENLLDAFRHIAEGEHANVVADAALALLAHTLVNHPDREEMVQHVVEHLPSIVADIAARESRGESSQQGSA